VMIGLSLIMTWIFLAAVIVLLRIAYGGGGIRVYYLERLFLMKMRML